MNPLESASDISSLVSTITAAVTNIESFYGSNATKPAAPSLDDVDHHPLDVGTCPLEVKRSIQMLEGACVQLCATLARPNHTMLNRYMKIFEPVCLGIVIRARVADILLDKPMGLPVSEIGEQCGIEPRKLSRILRTLCSTHIFREVANDVFTNNRLSMQLVSSTLLWNTGMFMVDDPNGKAALHLVDTLLDPEWGPSYAADRTAFNRSTGYPHPLYTFFAEDAERGARFGKTMMGWNEAVDAGAIVTDYPWGQLPSCSIINDLGGGVGHIMIQLHQRHPNLNLKLQDLPERVEQAQNEVWPKECPEAIASGKIEFKAVDLLSEIPISDCDIYLLKNVIHNMPHDSALKVLVNTRKAMGPNSRLLISEYVIQSTSRVPNCDSKFNQAPIPLLPNFGAGRVRTHYLDMAMMTIFNAEERTFEEYIGLVEMAGLCLIKAWDLGDASLLELGLA